MQGLQGLKRSINSAENLQSIVSTMKAHASSSITQFQKAARASMEYRKILDMSLYIVLSDEEELMPIDEVKEGDVIHIVFGSDHGLAGRFNERIANFAAENIPIGEKHKIIIVGQQIVQRLKGDFNIYEYFMQPLTPESISSRVNDLLLTIDEIRDKVPVEKIILYYNTPQDNSTFIEDTELLFPIDLLEISKGKIEWESKSIPMYFGKKEDIVSDLIKQYFFITIYRAFCYSLASENASRLASMQSADKNIDERLEDLNYQYRRERQNSITEEINDVISGFKAIRGSKEDEEESYG